MNTEILYHVVVYGTLMTGQPNYRIAADAIARDRAIITGTLYDTGWGFPAFTPDGDDYINAELLLVNKATLDRMDRLEGCPDFYSRKVVKAYSYTAGWQDAYVYVMNRLPYHAVKMTKSWMELPLAREHIIARMKKETASIGNGDTKTMFTCKDTE